MKGFLQTKAHYCLLENIAFPSHSIVACPINNFKTSNSQIPGVIQGQLWLC